ncbi:uncharacterized protein ATNIH1004_005396 [Aspergillus tanneri]|uniref:Uncharacterized protein n=1 Tax=Aspergillus tanneri TaxID=1220188 RepID=A0A5M9MIA4_9EURO|nr:uncharacterized protein ATNIH1004_005396 [Aspergillus tanneri]KAA8646721.1 hypothetical protein ATNIH1004_005396 [Aspergillus tanneri]
MAATNFDAAAAGLAAVARACTLIADDFAEDAGFEPVGDPDLDSLDREILGDDEEGSCGLGLVPEVNVQRKH